MRLLLILLLCAWTPALFGQSNLGSNLAISGPGAGSDGSSKASGTSYSNVRDGNAATFWSPTSTSNQYVTVKWSSSVSSNTIILKEVGNRVTSWRLETNAGVVLATGTTIGAQRQVSYTSVSTNKIFLYVLTASAIPQIGEFEVYNASGSGGGGSSSTVQIQENTAGFCSVNGTVDNNHTGFTGSGFANTDNASGTGVNWRVNAASAGSYTLRWRYANGGTTDRPGRVLVGGTQQVASVSLGATGSWATWATSGTATVTLAAGANDIRLEATTGSGLGNIDWIEVTGNGPTAVACSGGGTTTYTLSVSNNPSNGGSVSLSPAGGTYAAGTVVTLTASPASGYTFANWSGAASGSSATTTVTMNNNLSVTANYQQSGGGGGSSGANFALVGYATLAGGTTGGANGTWTVASTDTAIQQAINNKGSAPLTIYVDGVITPANSPGLTKIDIKDVRDVSILGMGNGAEFDGIGIKVFRAGNVIIRNLKVHNVSIGDKDCITLEGPVDHVWVDHCELYNQYQGVGKDFYDGLLDLKGNTDYVTFSWNYFHDSWKCSISGSGESDVFDRRVTYHHNIYENINSRVPLFRSGEGHIYNNYYKDIASTTINSRINACVRIENNYFENAINPWVSAYSNVLGAVQTIGNTLVNSPFDFSDSDVNEALSCTLTPPYSYSSTLNSATGLPTLLQQNAGVGVVSFAPPTSRLGRNTTSQTESFAAWEASFRVAPNPSQGEVRLIFDLPADDHVAVQLYNRLGQEIATLIDGRYAAGHHEVAIDPTTLAADLYFIVATSSQGVVRRHLLRY
ncbi:MAG: hypothetical protein OHK0039_46100 [Bacteroidia bacterium]